jgi:hypothetical protein
MKNVLEFMMKLIIISATYYITLEYIFVCELQTWVGGSIFIAIIVLITILYMIFRAGKISRCNNCTQLIPTR